MKTSIPRPMRKPLVVGLSLGVTGIFFFYMNTSDESVLSLNELTESCEIQAEVCSIESEPQEYASEDTQVNSELVSEEKKSPVSSSKEKNVRKQAKNYKFRLLDTTGDGIADAVDVDLDGHADYLLGDLDADGIADFADLNGDTIADVVFYDDNGDGQLDSFDTNLDQRPNGVFVDLDGDGFKEAAKVQNKTEICYSQQSGLKQERTLNVNTSAISDFLARGARIGSCASLMAQKDSN